jgi:oxygen-independent coproporphyrinogen-3 oxidase
LTVDRGLFAALTDVDVVEESAGIWQSLAELGWVTVTPSHVHVVGDGVFYTPLIQSLLARDRVSELRRTGFVRSE